DQERALLQRKENKENELKVEGIDLFDEVDEEGIAEVLALWTGIPVYKLTEEETAKLVRMEDELHKRVIGQDDAIRAVSQAIRRTRDGFNTLLPILEDGRRTDAQGRQVDFKNTVLIMTSNLGTADLRKAAIGFAKTDEAVTYEKMKERVNEALKQHFRPEFLNRIDDVIVFHALSKEEVIAIVDRMIKRV